MAVGNRGKSGVTVVWEVAITGFFRGRIIGRKDRNFNRGKKKE
jgi:hypothetical protein